MTLWMRPRRNDEADKATWPDLSGLGNDGTLNGFAWTEASGWTPYPALKFAGDNDYVDCGDIGAAEDKTFTYEVWAQTTTTIDYKRFIYEASTISNFPLAGLDTYVGRLRGVVYDDTGTGISPYSAAAVNDGATHHGLLVADGSKAYVVLDNVWRAGTTLPAGTLTLNTTCLGVRKRAALDGFLPGSILAARIYNRALSAAEVAQNYAAGPAGKGYVKDGLTVDLNAAYCVPLVPKLVYRSGQEALSWR